MNRCPNCGAQNRDGAKFCTSCGFRMPAPDASKPAATATAERSPFATTSTVGRPAEPTPPTAPVPPAYESWTEPIPPQATLTEGPGGSWDSPPPVNTAVPVSDEMIASLIGTEQRASETDDAPVAVSETDDVIALGEPEETIEATASDDSDAVEADSHIIEVEEPVAIEATDEAPEIEPFQAEEIEDVAAIAPANPSGDASIDSLLKLVRDLEYGLVELADARSGAVTPVITGGADVGLLQGALQGLSSEDDLASLRDAIATAQDRPRDVDVMLDLVLRADAIATVIGERDQLKSAIELALRNDDSATDDE